MLRKSNIRAPGYPESHFECTRSLVNRGFRCPSVIANQDGEKFLQLLIADVFGDPAARLARQTSVLIFVLGMQHIQHTAIVTPFPPQIALVVRLQRSTKLFLVGLEQRIRAKIRPQFLASLGFGLRLALGGRGVDEEQARGSRKTDH